MYKTCVKLVWIPFSCLSLGSQYYSCYLTVTLSWLTRTLELYSAIVEVMRNTCAFPTISKSLLWKRLLRRLWKSLYRFRLWLKTGVLQTHHVSTHQFWFCMPLLSYRTTLLDKAISNYICRDINWHFHLEASVGGSVNSKNKLKMISSDLSQIYSASRTHTHIRTQKHHTHKHANTQF